MSSLFERLLPYDRYQALYTAASFVVPGAAAGVACRMVTGPWDRFEFMISKRVLYKKTPPRMRWRYLLWDKLPAHWPQVAHQAAPSVGSRVPYPIVSSVVFGVYTGTKVLLGDLTPKGGGSYGSLSSQVIAALAAGFSSRVFFRKRAKYLLHFPLPYTATAFPIYEQLRQRDYNIAVSSLAASCFGSTFGGAFFRYGSGLITALSPALATRLQLQFQPFQHGREVFMFLGMHGSRGLPKAILLAFYSLTQPLFLPPSARRPDDTTDLASTSPEKLPAAGLPTDPQTASATYSASSSLPQKDPGDEKAG